MDVMKEGNIQEKPHEICIARESALGVIVIKEACSSLKGKP